MFAQTLVGEGLAPPERRDGRTRNARPYGSVGSDDIVRRRKDRGDGDLLIRHGFAMPPSPLGKAW